MMDATSLHLVASQSNVVANVLRHDGALLRLGDREDDMVGLAAQVRPFGHRDDIMAPAPELVRGVGWPHLIKQQLHDRSRFCSRNQRASASSASSSSCRIQSSISWG